MTLTTKHQVLAWDLVEGLGDEKHKGIYFRLAKVYDEAFLRKILSLVKLTHNEGKIKASDRGRYFMGILKKEISSFAKATEDKQIYGAYFKNNSRGRSDIAKKNRGSKKSGKSRN